MQFFYVIDKIDNAMEELSDLRNYFLKNENQKTKVGKKKKKEKHKIYTCNQSNLQEQILDDSESVEKH